MSPKFWIGATGKHLRQAGIEAQMVALYLLTSPHANMSGLYYQPLMYLAHETGLGIEGASKGLQRAIEVGFCAYDGASEVVWVYHMASYQVGKELKPADKRCLGMQYEYNELPENPYLAMFYDKYETAFCLTKKRYPLQGVVSHLPTPSEPLVSQAQATAQAEAQAQNNFPETYVVDVPKIPPVKTKRTANASALEEACHQTWESYCKAYVERYSTEPVRNATTNSQTKNLVKRLGAEEAPLVAAWFLSHRDAWYVRQLHQLGSLLKDCEKLRTEWATNRQMTHTQARQADRQGNTLSLVSSIIAKRERAKG